MKERWLEEKLRRRKAKVEAGRMKGSAIGAQEQAQMEDSKKVWIRFTSYKFKAENMKEAQGFHVYLCRSLPCEEIVERMAKAFGDI